MALKSDKITTWEQWYLRWSNIPAVFSKETIAEGSKQWEDFESRGKLPARQNAYFDAVLSGKKWWTSQINAVKALWGRQDWPGIASLTEGWPDFVVRAEFPPSPRVLGKWDAMLTPEEESMLFVG